MQIEFSIRDAEKWLKEHQPSITMGNAHLAILSQYAAYKVGEALTSVKEDLEVVIAKFPPE